MDPSECTEQMLEDLSTDLDTVGLPPINPKVDVLNQLVTSMHSLIQLYRNSLLEIQDSCVKMSVMKEDVNIKVQAVHAFNEKFKRMSLSLTKKDNELNVAQKQITDLQAQNKGLQSELLRTNELNKLLAKSASKPSASKATTSKDTKLNKLLREAEKLKEIQLVNEITGRVTKDEEAAKDIQKLEAKEDIYKGTIKALNDNNTTLALELLELQGKLSSKAAGFDKKSKRKH